MVRAPASPMPEIAPTPRLRAVLRHLDRCSLSEALRREGMGWRTFHKWRHLPWVEDVLEQGAKVLRCDYCNRILDPRDRVSEREVMDPSSGIQQNLLFHRKCREKWKKEEQEGILEAEL